jgi:hypothetical protein
MGKLQIPSSKHQGNFKHQLPNNAKDVAIGFFKVWRFFGAWMLEFGALA